MYNASEKQTQNVLKRYAKYLAPQTFPIQKSPLVITPHDAIVQQAAKDLKLENKVNVIKLEPTCPPGSDAWVANKDYIQGEEGKKLVVHLCYNKIRDRYRQLYKQNPGVQNPQQQQQLKEVIKEHLKNVTLPHEMVHIEQEVEHGGTFGPSPEPAAERAEHPENLKPYNVELRTAGR